MSLLAVLNLTTPSHGPGSGSNASAPVMPPTKVGAAATSRRRRGKNAPGAEPSTEVASAPHAEVLAFDDAETDTVRGAAASRIVVQNLVWSGGRGFGVVLGFANEGGQPAAMSAAWPEKDFGKLNQLADRGVALVQRLEGMHQQFVARVSAVRQAVTEGEKGLEAVKELGAAVTRRVEHDRQLQGDFSAYTRTLTAAKTQAKQVVAAANRLRAATSALSAAVNDKKTYVARKKVEQAEADVRKKEAEIALAMTCFNAALAVAQDVVKQDWGAIATKAFDAAQSLARDAAQKIQTDLAAGHLVDQLADLKSKLAAAQGEVGRFAVMALDDRVETKRAELEASAQELEIARDTLVATLAELPGAQTTAVQALKGPGTKPIADMISGRSRQVARIKDATLSCSAYLQVADEVTARVKTFIGLFERVPELLAKARETRPHYDDQQPFGRELRMAAQSNSVTFGDWLAAVHMAKAEAKDALSWLAGTDRNGPLGVFDAAILETQLHMGRGSA